MSRMSREFSLVLLGAGVLTAGYFAAPSPDEELEKKADEQAARQVHSSGSHTTHRSHIGFMPLIWVHSPGYVGSAGGGRPTAMTSVSRGGFGGIGHASSSGG
jgi:hypothetical protein